LSILASTFSRQCALASTLSVGLQVIFPQRDVLRRVMPSGGAFPDVPRSWHEAAAVITDRVARSRRVKQQGAAIRPGPFAHAGMETRYVMAF
jgi:hypothetical protein